jgi:hypothetical protein
MTTLYQSVQLDMAEVHDLSLRLLEVFEDEGVTHDMALAAAALTLVRLANPLEALPGDKEILYTQNIISMVQMQGGVVN